MVTHSNILAWRIPMDRGAWRAIVHRVAKSRTRLKQLSSSNFFERFPHSSVGKESTCNAGDPQFDSWVEKIHWRRDRLPTPVFLGFSGGSAGKESACNARDLGSIPGLGRSPRGGKWQPTPVFLPGKSPGTEEPGGLQSMGSQKVRHD